MKPETSKLAQWIWDNEVKLESNGTIKFYIEQLRKMAEEDEKNS